MTSDMLPCCADVAVVGGGTLGLFTALNLARAGRDVVVVDKGQPWAEASGANAGSLAVQNKMLELVPYTLQSLALWRHLDRTLGANVGFQDGGGYKVAMTAVERDRLLRASEAQVKLGVHVRVLEGADVEAEASWLGRGVVAATYSRDDCFSNPLLLGTALLGAVRRAGVRVIADTRVTGLLDNGAVEVATSRGLMRAGTLVIAAGAWTGTIAALLGVRLPMALEANMLTVTEPAGFTMGAIVTHARGILTLKQVANGTCLIGGGWLGLGTLEDARKEVDYESLLHNIRLAVQVVPGLAELSVVRQWAAYEGATPDFLPYLGKLPNTRSIFILAGARGGYTLSPIMGQLAAEVVMGQKPSMDVSRFVPGRFGNG